MSENVLRTSTTKKCLIVTFKNQKQMKYFIISIIALAIPCMAGAPNLLFATVQRFGNGAQRSNEKQEVGC